MNTQWLVDLRRRLSGTGHVWYHIGLVSLECDYCHAVAVCGPRVFDLLGIGQEREGSIWYLPKSRSRWCSLSY